MLRAPAPDEPGVERGVDHVAVDRVENDGRFVLHAQGGSGVDPEALPAAGAQFRMHLLGVVAALAGDHGLQALERGRVEGVRQRFAVGAGLADLGGGEIHGVDVLEVAFRAHAVH